MKNLARPRTITLGRCKKCQSDCVPDACPICRTLLCPSCMVRHAARRVAVDLPTFADVHAFLTVHYVPSRFGERDVDPAWSEQGMRYSHLITSSYVFDFEEGAAEGRISRYEANRGRWTTFDRSLTITNPDEPM